MMTQAHHRKTGDQIVATLPCARTRRNQLAILSALEQGVPLVGGQLNGKWVHSATLATLLNQWLIEVDGHTLTRAYRLTDDGRAVLNRYRNQL